MKKDWKIEKYRNNTQKEQIIELRKIVFNGEDIHKENIEFWDWEFENNYAGHARVYLAVEKENKNVVGHYAVCPSKIQIGEKERTGSIVVDVMTHPDYRFQGMFTEMGKAALSDSGKAGIDFSYGFPIRKGVMPGHLKIGWKVAFSLPVYIYPVNCAAIIRKFIPAAILPEVLGAVPQAFFRMVERMRNYKEGRYVIRESDRFEQSGELTEFIERTRYQHRIIQTRDFAFLDWRYNQNAFRRYKMFFVFDRKAGKMLGYIVLRKADIFGLECITIMDIQVDGFDGDVTGVLLAQARKYAMRCGAALVGCMTNKNHYKRYMLANFYIKSPYIFKFILHKNRDISYGRELLKSENWFLMWADTDDL